MFDDLRNSGGSSSGFGNENDAELQALLKGNSPRKGMGLNLKSDTFLGMNAFQRFFISAMLFAVVLILGLLMVMIVSNAI